MSLVLPAVMVHFVMFGAQLVEGVLVAAAAGCPGRVVVGFAVFGGPVAVGEQAGFVAGDDPAAQRGVGMAAGATQIDGGAGERVVDEALPVRVGGEQAGQVRRQRTVTVQVGRVVL
jgi:hypothetical protein